MDLPAFLGTEIAEQLEVPVTETDETVGNAALGIPHEEEV
jgi:hypothetical protein